MSDQIQGQSGQSLPQPDSMWKQAFQGIYREDLKRWASLDPWGQAKMLAKEDLKGTGDLLAEAVKNGGSEQVPVETPSGGVARILGGLHGR